MRKIYCAMCGKEISYALKISASTDDFDDGKDLWIMAEDFCTECAEKIHQLVISKINKKSAPASEDIKDIKEKAMKLLRAGIDPKQVAEDTGANLNTVKTWKRRIATEEDEIKPSNNYKADRDREDE